MRYVHPHAQHQADAVEYLEAVNAAKPVEEAERQKASEAKEVPTISTTVK